MELGDSLVRSHIGQPLSADIELTGIASETATVQVGLADPDVYRGANIAMHPALAALNITIVRRDGKRFLHIASPKAVESEYVHIFFELTENGRRSVRQATLWFTPDPNPAPPPAKAAPAPAAGRRGAVASAGQRRPRRPSAPRRRRRGRHASRRAGRRALLRAASSRAPAACVPKFTAAQIGACTALDAKNAALSAQIVDLEEKVRALTRRACMPAPRPRERGRPQGRCHAAGADGRGAPAKKAGRPDALAVHRHRRRDHAGAGRLAGFTCCGASARRRRPRRPPRSVRASSPASRTA